MPLHYEPTLFSLFIKYLHLTFTFHYCYILFFSFSVLLSCKVFLPNISRLLLLTIPPPPLIFRRTDVKTMFVNCPLSTVIAPTTICGFRQYRHGNNKTWARHFSILILRPRRWTFKVFMSSTTGIICAEGHCHKTLKKIQIKLK